MGRHALIALMLLLTGCTMTSSQDLLTPDAGTQYNYEANEAGAPTTPSCYCYHHTWKFW
jgi:hypothetical protein